MEHLKKYWFIYALILLAIIVYVNRKKWLGKDSTTTDLNQSSGRLSGVSSGIPSSISQNDKNIIDDLIKKISKFNVSNINDLNSTDKAVVMGYISDANSKLSDVKITVSQYSSKNPSTLNKNCNNNCIGEEHCKGGFGSGILGFCFCFKCPGSK